MSDTSDQKPALDDLEPPSQQADPMTPVKPKGAKILLTIMSPEGQEIKVNQKMTNTFEKLFKTAADRFGLDLRQVRFLHEGTRLRPEETPEMTGLADEDVIDIQVQQTGGAY